MGKVDALSLIVFFMYFSSVTIYLHLKYNVLFNYHVIFSIRLIRVKVVEVNFYVGRVVYFSSIINYFYT